MKLPKLVLTHWLDPNISGNRSWKTGDDLSEWHAHALTVGWKSHTFDEHGVKIDITATDLEVDGESDFRGVIYVPEGCIARRFTIPLPADVRAYAANLLRKGKR